MLALLAQVALAGPIVVWFEPEPPTEKAVARVSNDTGEAVQLYLLDLAFPPQPIGDADTAAYKKLHDGVLSARSKWDDFEVEYGIAGELGTAIASIDVIRDERDADALIEALAMQGAAVDRAFEEIDLQEGARAEPFRIAYPGTKYFIAPWVDALAIDPDHQLGPDVAEPATYPDLQKVQGKVNELKDGTLDLAALPKGASLVLDGVPVAAGATSLELRPGTHYVHVVRNGVVCGRAKVEISPATLAPLPMLVTTDELTAAKTKLLEGTTTGFPDDVKKALDTLAAYHKGAVFVAALDDGKVVVEPYASGAQLLTEHLVTFNFTGDVGAELVVSPIFDDAAGTNVTAPAVSGALGLELGISYGAIVGGVDAAFTPGRTVTFAANSGEANITTSALPQPWGGLGVYALRPVGTTPYVLFAGTYGWNGPAHFAPGGRVTLGIPFDTPKQWLRITLGGTAASKPDKDWQVYLPDPETPMYTLFLRLGVASGF